MVGLELRSGFYAWSECNRMGAHCYVMEVVLWLWVSGVGL